MVLKKVFLTLAVAIVPSMYAQTFGPLANFDCVNDTGKTAHGFEIDIDNIAVTDITSIFGAADRWPNMERYGAPTVTPYATGKGVTITYMAAYSGTAWSAGTPSGTLPVSPSDSCWPYGAPAYGPNYPCDHFGVSTTVSTPSVTYKWLVETPGSPSVLTPVVATVPNPVWTVVQVPPVANVPQPPQVNVVIVAPAPVAYEFGEPRWVKVTATGTLQDVAVEDLVAENAIIKKAQTQVQVEWQLLQVDSGSPGSGQIDLTGVALDAGATGVVYRFEFYKYTGARDPSTNEALSINGDTATPAPSDLGAFIVAQNAGINFDGKAPAAPPLPAAPVINAVINGATVNNPYNNPITATAGVAGDVLQISVTGLPAGLTFDTALNAIVGTPTVVGTFPLTITVLDTTNGLSTTGTSSLQVADSVIVFPLTFTSGTVGVSYSQKLVATGGFPPITYSIPANNLPAGLSLSVDTIAGTPTVAGTTSVTAVASDSLGFTQVATAPLVIAAAGPPPPVACAGTNQVISAASAVSFDIGGGLANGGKSVNDAPAAQTTFIAPLTSAGGILAGMLATYSGTVAPSGFCQATSMTIAAGLSLSPVTLAVGQVGSAYPTTSLAATGGVTPYTITVNGLPAGLTFNGATITGIPAVGSDGVKSITVSVKDANGTTVINTLSLTINPAPAVVVGTVTLPAGTVGSAYAGSAAASGGTGVLTWTATGLPAGLSVSASGAVSGTPTTAGTYSVVLTVTDTLGTTASVTKSVVISVAVAPLVVGTVTLPAGTVGSAYAGSAAASGGVGALTWTATGLPAGLSVSASGAVSGTPTTAGTYSVVLTVKDTVGTTASVTKSVVITAVSTCVAPAGAAKGLEGQGTIIVVSGSVVTFKTAAKVVVKVSVPACVKVEWNGAKGFAVGQNFEWHGYSTAALGNVATAVTIN